MENNVLYLKEEVKLYEREILKMLLQISESFSDINFTKTQRDDCFARIDSLTEKVKDIINVIGSIDKEKKEKDFLFDSNLKEKNCNVESVDNNAFNQNDLDKVGKGKENLVEEIDDNKNKENEENINAFLKFDETNEKEDISDYIKNLSEEIIDETKNEIKFQNRRKGREIFDSKEDLLENDFSDLDSNIEVDRIDKLIEEAKTLNSVRKTINDNKNVKVLIKVENEDNVENVEIDNEKIGYKEDIIPFSKSRINESFNNDEKSNNKHSDEIYNIGPLNDQENNKSISKSKDVIEPVPVFFGNCRANNQMVIRKKNTSFKDKIKTLIFKIKKMLGDKNEK